MKKEFQNKLFKKYPKIFRQKDLSIQETAMCWGIDCGDGWYDLIDKLCEEIQSRVNSINRNRRHKIENTKPSLVPIPMNEFVCEAMQVKEKWGTLRFYVYGGDSFVYGAISLAESLSSLVCSECGGKKDADTRISRCSLCQDRRLSDAKYSSNT